MLPSGTTARSSRTFVHDLGSVQVNLVDSWDEAQAFVSWLGERRPVMALDLETGGFDFWRHRIRTAQLGDANTGWVVPWERYSGLIEHAIERYSGPIALHNFMFDLPFMQHNGIPVPVGQVDDTRAMAHLINPNRPTGLKDLADANISRQASVGQKKLDEGMKANNWTWDTVPIDFPPYWFYGGLDVVFTSRLWEMQEKYFRSGSMKEIYDLEMGAQVPLMKMAFRGMRIDNEYMNAKSAELVREIDGISTELLEVYEITKPGSAPQVSDVMIADGVEWPSHWLTATGKPSTKDEFLEQIDHPVAHLVQEYRHKTKIEGSYFKNLRELQDPDGFVHPKINPLGAKTGRMTVTAPALQTLHRGPIVRDAFIPREGNVLIASDYDQIELRVLADFAKVEALQKAFREEPDVHGWMAQKIYGLDKPVLKGDPRRDITKNATYARAYGSGPDTFADTAGISMKEAYAFYAMSDKAFPELKTYDRVLQEQALEAGKANGCDPYVYTHYGRFQNASIKDVWKLVNRQVQGTSADVLKKAIGDLDAAGFGDYMVLPVHDEIIFDVPEDIAEEAAREIETVMLNTDFTPNLTAEAGIYARWGDKYR